MKPNTLINHWLLEHRDHSTALSLLQAFENSYFLLVNSHQTILYSNVKTTHLLQPVSTHLIGRTCPLELFNPATDNNSEAKTININGPLYQITVYPLLVTQQKCIGHLIALSIPPPTSEKPLLPNTDIPTPHTNFHCSINTPPNI